MEQITVRIREDTLEELESEVEDTSQTRSEHIRDILESRHEHTEHDCVSIEEFRALQRTLAETEQELEAVRNEKRVILQEREEKKQLQRYAEAERENAEKMRRASLSTRLRWFLFGDKE